MLKISFIAYVFLIGIFLNFTNEAEAQARKGKRSSKDKRISNYRGGTINFKKDRRYMTVGINLNSTNYFGDIAPSPGLASTDFNATRMGAGASTTYRLWSNISIGGSLNWNRLYGDDYSATPPNNESSGIYRYHRNLHFRNDIIELSGVGIVDAFHNRGTYFVRPPIVPYAFAGLAVFYHNPKAIAPATDLNGAPLPEAGKWVALRPLGTEGQKTSEYNIKGGYGLVQIAIPFGVGVRYKITNYLDLEMELSYRFLFTDYIDDVSKDYVDLGILDSELARAMSFRSLEPIAATSGKERMLSSANYSYVSRYDDHTFFVLTGYGHDKTKNNRGNSKDNDHYVTSSLKLRYILHGKVGKANFR
jgi:hypothetical protein